VATFVALAAAASAYIGLGLEAAAAAAAVAALGTLGIFGLMFLRIPETENHRLMIETSRFLKNQIVISELKDKNYDLGSFESYQTEMKSWLMNKLQEFMKGDFIEYNAHPYQRYSINAILNLYDFSDDTDIKTAAQMVLEYSAAKFAVGSNQG